MDLDFGKRKENLSREKRGKKMETSPPAYLRLYIHALESIFSYLNLPELASISTTCREWSSAVNSMRSIGARVVARENDTLDLHSMRTSHLVRHVLELDLDIDSVARSSDAVSILCDIIKQSKSLVNLNVSGNLDMGDLCSVAEATKQSRQLCQCIRTIAEAIGQSKSLTTVDLSGNSIDDEAASAIAEAIKQSKSLITVDLSGNCIGDIGASAIADAIQQSKSLTSVDLSDNYISDIGTLVFVAERHTQ